MPKYFTSETKSESANWNNAELYSRMIMESIRYFTIYDRIATSGTSNIIEEFTADEASKTQARISSINRMAKELDIIIRNSICALKKKDVIKVEKLNLKLKEVMASLKGIQNVKIDYTRNNSSVVVINEEFFMLCQKMLQNIYKELTIPLNENNLLFGLSEEFDPEEMKRKFIEEAINTP